MNMLCIYVNMSAAAMCKLITDLDDPVDDYVLSGQLNHHVSVLGIPTIVALINQGLLDSEYMEEEDDETPAQLEQRAVNALIDPILLVLTPFQQMVRRHYTLKIMPGGKLAYECVSNTVIGVFMYEFGSICQFIKSPLCMARHIDNIFKSDAMSHVLNHKEMSELEAWY